MNRFAKALLSLIVCIMGICCISLSASAETYGGTDGNITWELDDETGTLTISGDGDMNDYSSASGSQSPWYSNRKLVQTVVIEDGVTSIGNYAFMYCTNLTSITIPDGVTSIGNYAFAYCSSLKSVTLPDSLTSIIACAFYWCSSLASITIPDSVESIGQQAFYCCTSLKSITIPDGVTEIQLSTFAGCTSLTSITIPDSVESIGRQAFYGCTGLTSIIIPGSVESIEASAFRDCTSLTSAHYLGSKDNVTISSTNNSALTNNLHYMTLNDATVTCTDDGTRAYYSCDDGSCDVAIYIDDDGSYATTTISDTALLLAATGHSYIYTSYETGIHVITCEDCEETDTDECTPATEDWQNDMSGAHYIYCTLCTDVNGDTGYAAYELHDTDGYVAIEKVHFYSACSVCGYYEEDNFEEHDSYLTYLDNEDGSTHTIYCSVCEYIVDSAEAHTYDDGVLSTDGTYYTYTCEYCKYYYTEDVEEEEEDEEEETTDEDEDSEEDTEDTTTDDTSDSTDTTDTSTTTDSTTNTDTSTDTSDTTTTSTYTSAYIQYIGGILMSGNTSTSTSTVEDVSTGAGMTAEGSTTSSALAVVSLLGVAVMMTRKRR